MRVLVTGGTGYVGSHAAAALGSIDAALAGCDAVVHAASVYSLDPRDAPTIAATNVRGTETVLGAARRAGVDPIVGVRPAHGWSAADPAREGAACVRGGLHRHAGPKTDDSRTAAELGLQPPPLEETLADMIRWMVEAGRIPANAAGKLV